MTVAANFGSGAMPPPESLGADTWQGVFSPTSWFHGSFQGFHGFMVSWFLNQQILGEFLSKMSFP